MRQCYCIGFGSTICIQDVTQQKQREKDEKNSIKLQYDRIDQAKQHSNNKHGIEKHRIRLNRFHMCIIMTTNLDIIRKTLFPLPETVEKFWCLVFRFVFCSWFFLYVFYLYSCYRSFNIDQTYWNVSLSRHSYILYVHRVRVMNTVNHIDCHASYDMGHILR